MKLLLRILVRLYPATWRKRYGQEFETLLEDSRPRFQDIFDISGGAFKMQLKTRPAARIMMACATVGVLVVSAVSYVTPVRYQSAAMFSLYGAGSSATERLNYLQQHAVSHESLISIIQKHNLYPAERTRSSLDDVVQKMRDHIQIRPFPPTSSAGGDQAKFAVQFEYSDPRIAQKVTTELATRFMQANLEGSLENSTLVLRLFDPPSLPSQPTGSNRMRFIILGACGGLLTGAFLTLVRRLQNTAL